MQQMEDVPLPRVNFGSRRFTDKYAALIFLLCVIGQVVVTFHWISGANAYLPSPRDLDATRCESSSCYLQSFNCSKGQVKVINRDYSFDTDTLCVDACVTGYVYVRSTCLKESKFDAELLQRCANPSSEFRRLQDKEQRVTLPQVLADTWSIIFGLCALIFVLAIIWSYFTQHYTATMIWTTLFLQLAAGIFVGFYALHLDSTYTFVITLGITFLSAMVIFWKRKQISDTAALLTEACSSLRSNTSVFGRCY